MTPSRLLLRLIWALHRGLYALTGGRVGTRPPGAKIGTLFLLSRGRKSGIVRRHGLFYLEDGPNLVVVASNAGDAQDPQWWLNLQHTPDADVELAGRRLRSVRARRATPGEVARLVPRLDAGYAQFAAYRARSTREIPIVVLEPR